MTRCIAIDPDARFDGFDQIAVELREVCRDLMPKEHRLTRHLEEEEARAVRRAAFEDVAREALSAEAAPGAARGPTEMAPKAPARPRVQERSLRQSTAPLEGFVPKASPLPFSIKAPAEEPSGRGVGYTVRLPKPVVPEETEPETAPASLAALPVGRGRGHTMKIPKGLLLPPSPGPEGPARVEPPNRTETGPPASKTKTLEPLRMPVALWIVALMGGLGLLISTATAVLLLVNRASWSSALPLATAVPEPQTPAVTAASEGSAAASVPAATASAAASSVPSAQERGAPVPASVVKANEARPSAKEVETRTAPVKAKRAPMSGTGSQKPTKVQDHGPLIDFEDAPAPRPSGRR
ncbi:MAG TPA: hypothetical protein VEZ41_01940, partial [Allosphingosinicella sp.]|nr:hypothetical protein [Allosphingosinicella sp.]